VPLIGRAKEAIDAYLRDVRPEIVRNPKETAAFLSRSGG
jgi:site-specific recombinase XerD